MTSTTRVRRFNATDDRTGEVHSFTEEQEYVPRAKIRDPYVILFHAGIDQILAADLRGGEYRVWLGLLRRARVAEDYPVNVVELARDLGMHRTDVYACIRSLELAGLIRRPERGYYGLVPEIVWRGSAGSREKAMDAEAVPA